jgi:ABC-type bacteriocin/lantibiotic exporter with double-glycine peptidase domain
VIKKLKSILQIVPEEKRKHISFLFLMSFINSVLDFISIAILSPFIILILDRNKANEIFMQLFGYQVQPKTLMFGLAMLLLFYIVKNLCQTRLIKFQSAFIYSISSAISNDLMINYVYGNFQDQIKLDKGSLIRDFQKLPVTFSTHVLFPLYTVFSQLFFVSILFIIGLVVNTWLSLSALILVLIGAILIISWRNKKIKTLNKTLAESFQESLNQMLNIFLGNLQIKSANAEKAFYQKFKKANSAHNSQVSQLSVFKQSNHNYLEILIVLCVILLLIYLQFIGGPLTNIIIVSVFASTIVKLLPAINKVVVSLIDIKANYHTVSILSRYAFSTKKNIAKIEFIDSLEINNGSFRYNDGNTIIENINFNIQRGDFISISGNSGIGKTTLLRILSGLMNLTNGTLKIDGTTQKTNSFYSFASFVTQQPFIFKASILDNICMLNNENINLSLVNELIDKFELTDFVSQLTNGLDTILDVDSMSLSGGQKQRIAIIRALYSQPKLLLLDEATNQLDEQLKLKILRFLKDLTLKKEISIVAVSHQNTLETFSTKTFHLE